MFGVIELTNPAPPEIEETSDQRRWLKLAAIALRLDEARKEQEHIKRAIRHSLENYKRLKRRKKAA